MKRNKTIVALALFLSLCMGDALLAQKSHAATPDPSPSSGQLASQPTAIKAIPVSAPTAEQSVSLDDYETVPRQSIADPLEPWNRFWFSFNDIFYLHIARPVYQGYTFIMPNEFQAGISNFFRNLLFPLRFVNSLLQGNPRAAGVEFGRFFINTTVGFGGFINAAKDVKPLPPVQPTGEDFGQTLGVWGVGQGFYIVWPFLAPSSARDSVGMLADWALDPTFYLQPWLLSAGTVTGLRFNELGHVLPLYDDVKGAAVDPYIAMREAYSTYRQNKVMH